MTWNDLVRKYFPDVSDNVVEFILWEKTAFPMAPADHIEKQLQDLQISQYTEKRSNYYKA